MGKMFEGQSRSYAEIGSRRFFGDPLGGREGRKGVKIGSMSRRKSSLALEKSHFKHIGQCQAHQGVSILTGGTRNLKVCVGW